MFGGRGRTQPPPAVLHTAPASKDRVQWDDAKDTPLEFKTDGESLGIGPVTLSKMDRVIAAADGVMDAHEETFRKLAK